MLGIKHACLCLHLFLSAGDCDFWRVEVGADAGGLRERVACVLCVCTLAIRSLFLLVSTFEKGFQLSMPLYFHRVARQRASAYFW